MVEASASVSVPIRQTRLFFVLLVQTPSERQRIQREVKKMIYEAMEN